MLGNPLYACENDCANEKAVAESEPPYQSHFLDISRVSSSVHQPGTANT